MKIQVKKLLVIGYVWPEPNSSAAGSRMMQLLKSFLHQGYEISFASPAKLGEHKTDLTKLGIKECNIQLNNKSFDEFILQLEPHVVLFDRFMMEEQFGWRVAKHAPNAIRVLNTEDLHSLREARQQIIKDFLKTNPLEINLETLPLFNTSDIYPFLAKSDLAKREIASLFRCDLNLMISEYEINLLKNHFSMPENLLLHLPFMYPESTIKNQGLPSFSDRQHFVSIGNFRHAPNWDAVLWLKQAIWPKIRQQLPNAECHIYGAYPPPKATALHNEKQGFLIKGWAVDAHEVIQNARVLLAPLRFGAGIKGKLAEAMCNATPSVTTSIGSEAMLNNTNLNWPGAVANNSNDFTTQAVKLYQSERLWAKHSESARQLFKEQYQVGQNNQKAKELFKILETLQNHVKDNLRGNLQNHRQQNFIGSMLNHHHHKSTQYMSQWIAEKNKHY